MWGSSINIPSGSLFDTPRERDRRLKMLRRELSPEQLQRYSELEDKRNTRGWLAGIAAAAGITALGIGGGYVGGRIAEDKMGADAPDIRTGRAIGAVVGVQAGALGAGIWLAIRSLLKNKARNRAALRKYKRGDLAKYLDNSKGWSPWSIKDEAELDELTHALTPMYYDDPSTAK